MKRSLLFILPVSLASLLVAVGCSSPGSSDGAGAPEGVQAQTSSFKYGCTVDTARLGKFDDQHFASLELDLSGDSVKISKIVYADKFVKELEDDRAAEQKLLASGKWDDGTALTDAEKAETTDEIDQDTKILAANTDGTLSFAGTVKPYKKAPKVPTVQYPLNITGGGAKADNLWQQLGKEGTGARLLMPPPMATGADGKPDIEWDGNQGPQWDRYDCKLTH
jgi:hypothetical protein